MSKNLKQRSVDAVMWSAIERFSTQAVYFVMGVFIARMLTPSDYGTVALLNIFFAISNTFIDSGFSSALIRKVNRTQSDNSTTLYFNIAVGVVLYGVLWLCAPLIAQFFEEPLLVPLTRIIGLSVIFNSLSIVQYAILITRIDFKVQAQVSLCSALVSGCVGLALAYSGYGVWALAVQMVVNNAVRTVALWMLVRWRPTMPFSASSFRELFGYGSKVLGAGLLDSIYNNSYGIVVGKMFDPTALGYYSKAKQYGEFASLNISNIIERVTFPTLCSIQCEQQRLITSFRMTLRLAVFIIFPMMMGLSALCEPLIVTLITRRWLGAAPLLRVICFALMWYPILALNGNLLQVKGRSDMLLRVEIIKKIIGILTLCATIPGGVLAICYGQIFAALIFVAINTHVTGHIIGVGFRRQVRDITPSLMLSLAMWWVVRLTSATVQGEFSKLVVGVFAGVTFYISAAYATQSKDFKTVVSLIWGRNRHTQP